MVRDFLFSFQSPGAAHSGDRKASVSGKRNDFNQDYIVPALTSFPEQIQRKVETLILLQESEHRYLFSLFLLCNPPQLFLSLHC